MVRSWKNSSPVEIILRYYQRTSLRMSLEKSCGRRAFKRRGGRSMGVGWTRGLALPVLLLTLLAACQSGPYQRGGYARTAGYSQSPGYDGCGYDRCSPRRFCPPGYILTRIPYAYGGPGRYCKPYQRRCCSPTPSPCGSSGPGPCQQGGGRPYAAY